MANGWRSEEWADWAGAIWHLICYDYGNFAGTEHTQREHRAQALLKISWKTGNSCAIKSKKIISLQHAHMVCVCACWFRDLDMMGICSAIYGSIWFGLSVVRTLNTRSIKLPLHFALSLSPLLSVIIVFFVSCVCVCLFSCFCLHHTHTLAHTHLFYLFIRVLFILFNARGNKAKRHTHTHTQQWDTALKTHSTVAAPLSPWLPHDLPRFNIFHDSFNDRCAW